MASPAGLNLLHAADAGGSLYHELRQGKLMLMPSFTSSFQKMLKWLMAPAPGVPNALPLSSAV